jgi:hypothetical protein
MPVEKRWQRKMGEFILKLVEATLGVGVGSGLGDSRGSSRDLVGELLQAVSDRPLILLILK